MILSLLLFIVVMLMLIAFLVLAWDKIIVGKVPFISIPQPTLDEIIAHTPIAPHDTFYDLGCGDGRVLVAAAHKQPKAQYIGVEKAVWPYLLARYHSRNLPNVRVLRGDITKVDFSSATIIFIYLLPELIKKIQFNLAGKKIIAVEYKLTKTRPSRVIALKNKTALIKELFLYK
jgi:predicted RNA methylase